MLDMNADNTRWGDSRALVLLPPPERPTSAHTVPAGMVRLTPSNTFWCGRICDAEVSKNVSCVVRVWACDPNRRAWYVKLTSTKAMSPRSAPLCGMMPPAFATAATRQRFAV